MKTFANGNSSSEPFEAFGSELDKTAVISDVFKERLWLLMSAAVSDAYERGQKSMKKGKKS